MSKGVSERDKVRCSPIPQPDGFAVAGHTATLTADGGRLVVVGGVNSDLHISPKTLLYHLGDDSWEVMPTRTLDPPGELA